MRCT
jgi:O-glycosyl hydrolase